MPSEISLENLQPGPKGDWQAGRNLILAAISAALVEDFQDDEAVRFELGKVFDFVVTEAARAAVVERKAVQVYNAIFNGISAAIVGGDVVSLNGFATMQKNEIVEGWEVGIERGTNAYYPILPTDDRIRETRTAEIVAGSWAGETLAAEYIVPGETFSAGTVVEHNSSTGVDTVINGSIRAVSGTAIGIRSSVLVTALGDDAVTRTYGTGALSIVVYVERQLRPLPNGDLQMWYLPVGDQQARIDAARVGISPESIEAHLGDTVPMGVGEWGRIAGRDYSFGSASDLSWEFFRGIPAAAILAAYPKTASVVRAWGGRTFDVKRIPPAIYRAQFGWQEAYLKSIGAWPERTRNRLNGVACNFRAEFIEAVQ